MKVDKSLAAEFKPVKRSGETIIWAGKPRSGMFILNRLPFTLAGAVFVWLFVHFVIVKMALHDPGIIFIAVAFSVVFLSPLSPVLSVRNAAYAITNERVLIREGVWTPSFASIPHDCITEIRVRPGLFEGLMGLGSIELYCNKLENASHQWPQRVMLSITEPYKVFNQINQCLADVRSNAPGGAVPAAWPREPDPIEVDLSAPFDPKHR